MAFLALTSGSLLQAASGSTQANRRIARFIGPTLGCNAPYASAALWQWRCGGCGYQSSFGRARFWPCSELGETVDPELSRQPMLRTFLASLDKGFWHSMSERPDLAIMMFDYAPSGVVRNALRIAGAAHEAGMRTEVWTAQGSGEMAEEIPQGVVARSLDVDLGDAYSLKDRKRALARISTPLAGMMAELRPRILLSAGNHFHKPAVAAIGQLVEETAPRLIGRVSNALPRFSWWPAKLPNSIFKRVNARRRYQVMDRLIAVSAQVRRDLQDQAVGGSVQHHRHPERNRHCRRSSGLAESHWRIAWFGAGQPPVIVAAGRLTHQKGFDVLLRAFALARARRPMRLIILGKGPEQDRLQALAEHLGIAADVELRGHVGNPLPYLRRADLFVLPSRWEGLSNAFWKPWQAARPVVATRCTGSAELLDGAVMDRSSTSAMLKRWPRAFSTISREERSPTSQLERAREYDLARTLRSYVTCLPRGAGACGKSRERSALPQVIGQTQHTALVAELSLDVRSDRGVRSSGRRPATDNCTVGIARIVDRIVMELDDARCRIFDT